MKWYNKEEIKDRARAKAFSKLATLRIEIEQLKEDLKDNYYRSLSEEELSSLLESTQKQYSIWNYIAKLIETDLKQ